jgi:hypothetical protein
MTDESTNEKLDRIASLLEEQLKWQRIDGMGKVEALLKELMKRDVEKLVYENSDGRGSREVGEASGVSHMTVFNYWNKWAKYGLVEEVRSKGGTRYRKSFSLSDFGIETPTKASSGTTRGTTSQSTPPKAVDETAQQPETESKPAAEPSDKTN